MTATTIRDRAPLVVFVVGGAAGLLAAGRRRRANLAVFHDLHADLRALVVDRDNLLEVAPAALGAAERARQDLCCRLILGVQELAWRAGVITGAELRQGLTYWLAKPAVRAFWLAAGGPRLAVVGPAAGERRFHRIADAAYRAAGDGAPTPPETVIDTATDTATDTVPAPRPPGSPAAPGTGATGAGAC